MALSTTRVAVGFALLLAVAFALHVIDRDRWRTRLTSRFAYGIPWGTAVTVGILVAFYLFAQHGFSHWDEPVIYPYVSWSYFYPTGWLTAGIAHGSPAHLVSNATATVVFGVIAEYTWGHYPRTDRSRAPGGPPTHDAAATNPRTDGGPGPTSAGRETGGAWSHPVVRAVVLFPAALLAIALATAVFSLGPGLGFSGAVYAIVGFTLVAAPRLAIGGVVGTAALGVLYDAVTNPIVTEAIESGPPSPPSWAGIGFHAHLLGFLLGVLCAVALLRRRRRRPDGATVFAALVLVGLVQSLWLFVWPGDADTYTLYRGAGVAFVIGLAVLATVAATGSDGRLPRPLSRLPWAPSRRGLAISWIGVLTLLTALLVVGAVVEGESTGLVLGVFLAGYALLALPALPPLLPDRVTGGPVGYRQAALVTFCALTALVALVSVPYGFVAINGAPSGSGAVDVGDYTITYEENATVDRTMLAFPDSASNTTYDGLLVASDDREFFTVGERDGVIAHDGEATVAVGGPGWYETVHAERSGWDVLGNETVYAIDLTVDGETTRSYASEPVATGATFDDRRIVLAPSDDAFEVQVRRDGTTLQSVSIPEAGASATAGGVTLATESVGDVDRLTVSVDGATVPVAERETY